LRSGFQAIITLQITGIKRVHDLDESHPNDEHVRRGAAYNMSLPVRSKKMAGFDPSLNYCPGWTLQPENGGWDMTKRTSGRRSLNPSWDRREVMARLGLTGLGLTGLGLAALGPPMALAETRQSLRLRAAAGTVMLDPARPPTQAASLQASAAAVRVKRGGELDVVLRNDLATPIVLTLHGIDGAASAEPLARRAAVAAGAEDSFMVPLRQAGTFLCDARLLGTAIRPVPLIIEDDDALAVDRDEVILVEDWRLRADGTAVAAGTAAGDAAAIYTVNGEIIPEITLRANQRLRFRFINGCQRNVIALKVEGHELRVMALDGAPAEPFAARNGALVLAPGGRADVHVDATAPLGSKASILLHDGKEARPIARLVTSSEPKVRAAPLPPAPALPANDRPGELDLKGALRAELTLAASEAGWVGPANFATAAAPAFRAKWGRTVVLALTNRGSMAAVFHLHGHHFRLLDRLDDGWKPFWLDTLAVEPGQTQRIAFGAEHAGRWLIESMTTDWAAPRLVRWYSVE
jgi:FtsP/CotA-like multicopper oxidase with cupredoxin domain